MMLRMCVRRSRNYSFNPLQLGELCDCDRPRDSCHDNNNNNNT